MLAIDRRAFVQGGMAVASLAALGSARSANLTKEIDWSDGTCWGDGGGWCADLPDAGYAHHEHHAEGYFRAS